MSFKEATDTDPGDATKYGAPDIKKIAQYLNGTSPNVAVGDIDSSLTVRSSKFFIRNPANTFSYTFIAAAIAANRNLTLPLLTGNDTIAVLAEAQTFINKTIAAGSNTITGIVDANIDAHTTSKITTTTKGLLNSAIVYKDQVNAFGDFNQTFRSGKLRLSNPANDFYYSLVGAAIAADRVINIPLLPGDDTLVTEAFTQPLTNKTLDSTNTISSATSLPIVTVAKGGTGQATATLGFDALSPMTTLGDIIIGGASGTRVRLGVGSANLPLKVNSGGTNVEYGALPIAGGGTGQTSQTPAFDALAPTTTAGDIIYNDGTDNIRLAIGTAGQPLKVNAGATAPEYGTLPVAGGGTGAVTLTGVLKGNGTGAVTAAAQLAIADGGTGQSTATAAFDALSPMTTAGDVIIGGASGTRTRLGIGTANQLLRTNSGATAPEWASTLSGLTLTTPTLTTPTINGMKGGDVGITNSDSPYTVLATTRVIRADATSGAITINLPTAVGIAGTEHHIFRTDITQSTNLITIDANSTETIDSNLTYILYPGEYVKLESDGANWQVISRPVPSSSGYYWDKGSTDNRRYVAGMNGTSVGLTTSTTLPALDTLWALPLVVSRTTKFDTITFRVTTVASAGGVAMAGIYRDNGNMYPGGLIFDTGSIDVTTGNTKATTITSAVQVFQPGLYWLAWQTRVAAPQIRILSGIGGCFNMNGHDVNLIAATNCNYGYSVANAANALPDPYTAAATALNTTPAAGAPVPAIGLRAI